MNQKDTPPPDTARNPQLTIGMPVYNMAEYVEAAVGSLLSQTFPGFRLVISDNASDDGTAEILRRLAEQDDRVYLIEQSKNLGATANFRAVLDACKTPWFMWAAADDVWAEDWIAQLLPLAMNRTGIAFGAVQVVDAALVPLTHPANNRDLTFAGSRLQRRLSYYLDPALRGRANPIYGIFRKDMLTTAAWAEFSNGQHGPDVMCLYVMLRDVELLCNPAVVLCKRKHGRSVAAAGGPRRRKPRFRRTQLPQFWRLSSWDERVGLILLYPVAVARVVLAKLAYLKGRACDKRGR